MGHIILPSGMAVWDDDIHGSVNLGELINDVCQEDYTVSYRYMTLKAIKRIAYRFPQLVKNAIPLLHKLNFQNELYASDVAEHQSRLLVSKASEVRSEILGLASYNFPFGGKDGLSRQNHPDRS